MRMVIELMLIPIMAIGLCVPAIAASAPTRTAGQEVHVSDAQLDSAIRAKLAKSKIGKDGFRFKVTRGVVTWEGSTIVPQHKGAATRMARTAGAIQVINNIQVAGGNKPGTPIKKANVQ